VREPCGSRAGGVARLVGEMLSSDDRGRPRRRPLYTLGRERKRPPEPAPRLHLQAHNETPGRPWPRSNARASNMPGAPGLALGHVSDAECAREVRQPTRGRSSSTAVSRPLSPSASPMCMEEVGGGRVLMPASGYTLDVCKACTLTRAPPRTRGIESGTKPAQLSYGARITRLFTSSAEGHPRVVSPTGGVDQPARQASST